MLCAQRSAPAIFLGRVTKAVNEGRVRVTVLEGFKGVVRGSVVELPSGNGAMCGYDFKVGETYLIFASPTESGALTTGLCSGNRRLSQVSPMVLDDLQNLQRGYGRSEIVGALLRLRAGGPLPALPNIRVTASRGGKSFHAITNKQGRFRIGLDGPGDYAISADLPDALTLVQAGHVHATVVERACTWVDLTAVNNARISGRLIAPAGVDVQGIPINVTSTDGRATGVGAETDVDGRFEVAGIEPGEYLLGINIPCIPYSGLPLQKTLYPGVHNDADATRFQIAGPVKIEGRDLPFSGPVPTAPVSVTVTAQDGHPVKGAHIQRSNGCITDLATSTDETGRATLELFRGDRWTLAATLQDETTGVLMCSTVERAGPDMFPASIQFVIDQPSCRPMRNILQIDRMKNVRPGEYRTVPIRVTRTDGRAMLATTVDITSEEHLSLVQLEAGEDGRLDVPLPVGRMVLLAARDAGCSSVPIVVDASGPTVRWRRLGPDENLSTWRAAGPFNSAEGLELVLERVAPWCR